MIFTLFLSCTEQSVTAKNAPPSAEITSHQNGATAQEGYAVLLRGSVSDPDNDALNLSTLWYLGSDEICNGMAEGDGTSTCEIIMDTEGVVTLEVRDPQNSAGTDSITFLVEPTSGPTVSITAPTEGEQLFSNSPISFAGTVFDDEDAPEDLIVEWTSDLDGLLTIDTEPDSSGAVQGNSLLSEGTHLVVLSAEDTTGKVSSDSISLSVSPPNEIPLCSISNPTNNSGGPEGSLVIFEGETSDPDGNNADLLVQWISDKDGLMGTSLPDNSGQVSFASSSLSVNTHTISIRVTDPSDALCVSNVIYSVSTPPVLTLTSPLDGEIYPQGDNVAFEGTVSDGEDQAVDILLTWTSSQDGLISSQGADSSGEIAFSLNSLTPGPHDITAVATDTAGLFDSEMLSIRINEAPSQPTVTLSPIPTYTTDIINCTPTGSTDPDGQSLTYLYLWERNGQPTSYNGASLSNSATSKNQSWACIATPNDGIVNGPSNSASTVISNSDPVLNSISILPGTNVATNALLTCSPIATDADNEPLTTTYLWAINGNPAGTANTLDLGTTNAQYGDTISCTATISDSDSASVTGTATAMVSNGPPVISSLSISPSSPDTNSTLNNSVSATDPEGDPITYSYEWRVNGVLQSHTGSTLDGVNYFGRDDLVAVSVTPADNTQSGQAVTSVITIQNTAPTSPGISLSPSNPVEGIDNIQCLISSPSTDIDVDPIDYIISWTVDGISYPDGDTASGWQGPSTTQYIDDTVPFSDTLAGDLWVCTVIPTDNTDDGSSTTASVTVSPSSSCGNNVLDSNEEGDPAPGAYNNISLDPITCRWDFSSINQLYCNGGCTWSGSSDCDQTEADIFCKLKMDNPNSTATSWTSTTALPEHGFPCTWNGDTLNIVNRGVSVPVTYQDSSILGDHGPGNVIAYPNCTDP